MKFRERLATAIAGWILCGAGAIGVWYDFAQAHAGLVGAGILCTMVAGKVAVVATRGAVRSWRFERRPCPKRLPPADWALIEAMQEVDRLLPGSPRICPNWPVPMPAPTRQKLLGPVPPTAETAKPMGLPWYANLVKAYQPSTDLFTLNNGMVVTRQWLEASKGNFWEAVDLLAQGRALANAAQDGSYLQLAGQANAAGQMASNQDALLNALAAQGQAYLRNRLT